MEAFKRTAQGIVPIAAVQGHLHGGLVAGDAAHPHPARMIAGVTDRRCPAGADPAVAAVVLPVLILEARLEIVQQLFGGQPLQFFVIYTQRIGHFPWVAQPLLQQAPGHLVEFQALHVGQLGPGKRMGKDLVVAIEIALAFDQDGPAGRVKSDNDPINPVLRARCRVKKGGRTDRHPAILEGIKKIDEHQKSFRRCTTLLARW
jgi:hypothetical protein